MNFVVNQVDPNYPVNLVVNYIELVYDKVHEVVVRDGSRQSSRYGWDPFPAEHYYSRKRFRQ